MTTNSNTTITKRDLWSIYFRSFTMESSWNYERMMHMGYTFAMVPAIRKTCKTDKEVSEALVRHLEFFNTTPHLSTLPLGISTAMEERRMLDDNFDASSINAVKASLMGPLAGIGDSFFWGTLRIIAAGLGISLASSGSILGPLLFLLVFNIPHYFIRYFCLMGGYRLGADFFKRMEATGMMQKITYGAAILGLMVIGGMTATMVSLNVPFVIGEGDFAVPLQNILNDIMPCLLPMFAFAVMYYLLGKNIRISRILIGIVVISIASAYLNILG
ncbi:PTS system mannose/fructose/sorbose family transporter subunit IID [Salmonella enterica]|nr:PTS system mannose/fructose/sorbose family transporter subunit IID [Salmonella enterica subsp. enterica serovar Poona]EHX7008929.1 PTS system mannose/fructose/sorbose family transporter subunit IID [Salmonella enterica subsp. enterica serovar Concord]